MAVTIHGSTGVDYADNRKQTSGPRRDVEIYHNGSHSFINETGSGNLAVQTSTFSIANPANDETLFTAVADGAVTGYHNNSKKFETTSGGFKVSGNLVVVGDDVRDDNHKSKWGSGDDLQIWHDGTHNNIKSINGELHIKDTDDGYWIRNEVNGPVTLYHNGSAELSTTSTGCDIFSAYDNAVGGSIRDLYIRNDGRLGYDSSVRASKVNIADLTDVSWLDDLKPKTFNKKKQDNTGAFTSENYTQLEYGLIAEDVETVNKELCSYSTEDVFEAVHYKKLITPILKALQDARTEITTLKAKVAALETHTHE
jgi:hypothetical protein